MGIIVVLIFYAIALTIAALVAAAVLGTTAYVLTRSAGRRSRRAVIVSALFPFACCGFAACCFASYWTINQLLAPDRLLHR